MSRLQEKLGDFAVQHPIVGGLAFIVVGVVMIGVSIGDAREFHEFEHARELSAQVVSFQGPLFLRFVLMSRSPGRKRARTPTSSARTPASCFDSPVVPSAGST